MAGNSFAALLKGFSRGGRELLRRNVPFVDSERARDAPTGDRLIALARALLSVQGEASGTAIAADLLDSYAEASAAERLELFCLLAEHFGPVQGPLKAACEAYASDPSNAALGRLIDAIEPPRRELFQRLNLAPGATVRLTCFIHEGG